MERFVKINLTCTLQPKMRNEMRDMRTKQRKLVQSDVYIKCANMRTRKQFYHNRGRGMLTPIHKNKLWTAHHHGPQDRNLQINA